MTDYIDKKAAIEIAVDAWNESENEIAEQIWLRLRALPSADVVAIVRCTDCKHRDTENGFCEGRGCPMQLVPDDGFCDKGERRYTDGT